MHRGSGERDFFFSSEFDWFSIIFLLTFVPEGSQVLHCELKDFSLFEFSTVRIPSRRWYQTTKFTKRCVYPVTSFFLYHTTSTFPWCVLAGITTRWITPVNENYKSIVIITESFYEKQYRESFFFFFWRIWLRLFNHWSYLKWFKPVKISSLFQTRITNT